MDTFLKSQNYTIALPILKQVCGELADDATEAAVESYLGSLMSSVAMTPEQTRRPSVLGPGFSSPPGGPAYLNRTVMSYHYYCWALGYASSEQSDPVLTTLCDEILGPMVFKTVDARARELGGSATMLTEFGECNPDSEHPDEAGL